MRVAKVFVSVCVISVDHLHEEVLWVVVVSELGEPLEVEDAVDAGLHQHRDRVAR